MDYSEVEVIATAGGRIVLRCNNGMCSAEIDSWPGSPSLDELMTACENAEHKCEEL